MEPYLLSSQKQDVNHGTILSPYAHYNCIIPTVLPDVLLHWHVEAEITLVLEGSAIYKIGEETFHSRKGDFIFVAPNTLHSVQPLPGITHISDTLVFHLDMLGYSLMDQYSLTYLHPIYNGFLRPISHMSQNHPLYPEFSECAEQIFLCVKNKDIYFEMFLKEQLHHLFYLLFKYQCFTNTDAAVPANTHMDKVKEAVKYIQENYQEPISICELADLCHFSKTHFMYFFKQTVGITCVEYMIQHRLKVAANLLRASGSSISEIAFESGFHNLSNFNRKFKNHYHMTPLEYRRQQIT
ncbi:AraC family transcriptional regulator [Lacrimispora sp.]|uniref:AraC family transcriptional regulator n=1 Tax=Lacrimispora sp. TaxID=2719234 RepID=UPI0028A1B538|nr:AraC family transcriptional regulator [Lacrimispora sp.]